MDLQTYNIQIELNKKNQQEVGKLVGKAIRDKDISPVQYEQLCTDVKKIGFKFKNIVI